jgi:SAM-dependent methyltransferase
MTSGVRHGIRDAIGERAMRRGLGQAVKDLLAAPVRLTVLPNDVATRLGLTSRETERVEAALRHVRGRLLDLGCGRNALLRRYGLDRGVGVDVVDLGGGALIVPDTTRLPFADGSFDTVTCLANLNHIPDRVPVLREARRVLAEDGRLVATMIDPVLGWLGHRLFWWDDPDAARGMRPGERYGLWPGEVVRAAAAAGFGLERRERFAYGLNGLYVFRKRSTTSHRARSPL